MRDFRDAKAMAKTLRAALAAKGMKISIGESLELTAKALGAADWNTLAAAIRSEKAAEKPPAVAAQTPSPITKPPTPTRTGIQFSANLDATLHRAVGLAQARSHNYTTLEHLLLALTEDADASAVLDACRVDLALLKATLTRYVDDDLLVLVTKEAAPPAPTAGFHRVIQRAVIHVQSSGRHEVTAANVLVAIFSESESHAFLFLAEQGMTRFDAVNFIAHGNRKGDAAA
jgi:hypothetical protein